MIIKSNNEVSKNFLGANNITAVYAGENLVFGQANSQEDPNKTATGELNYFTGNINNTKLQGSMTPIGSVSLDCNQAFTNAIMTIVYDEGSDNTISFSGIDNIQSVEVKIEWSGNDIHAPMYGTTVSTGQIVHYPQNSYSIWTFAGSTGTISYNNYNRDPSTKKYLTYVSQYDITVHYTI